MGGGGVTQVRTNENKGEGGGLDSENVHKYMPKILEITILNSISFLCHGFKFLVTKVCGYVLL